MDGCVFEFVPYCSVRVSIHFHGLRKLQPGAFQMSLTSLLHFSILWRCVSITAVAGLSISAELQAFQSPSVIQLSASTAPAIAESGVTVIYLTGSGYPAGIINAAQVSIQLQPQAPATGPAMNAIVSTVTTVAGSTRRVAFFAVPANSGNNIRRQPNISFLCPAAQRAARPLPAAIQPF